VTGQRFDVDLLDEDPKVRMLEQVGGLRVDLELQDVYDVWVTRQSRRRTG